MSDALRRTHCSDPSAAVEYAQIHHDVVVPLANGEPDTIMAALDAAGPTLEGVRVHQMHSLRDRPYLHGVYPGLRHVSYFLSHVTRPCFAEGGIDFAPAHFSEMPHILDHVAPVPVVVAAATPPDRHGWFSLGTNADYVARLIGKAPFFLEANPTCPAPGARTRCTSPRSWVGSRPTTRCRRCPRPRSATRTA